MELKRHTWDYFLCRFHGAKIVEIKLNTHFSIYINKKRFQ